MKPPNSHSLSGNRVVLAGIAFMLVGTSVMPLMNTFGKLLVAEFPLWQVTWARFLSHLVLLTLLFYPRHRLTVYRTANPPLQFNRSAIFFISNACFIGALPWVSLAVASSIMFTAPIIVTIISVVFLGERVGVWRWGAVGMGFVGALIIVQPGAEDFEPATLLTLTSAFCYAIYQLLTRRLVEQDSPETQIIYTALVGALVTSCIIPFVGTMPDEAWQVSSFILLGAIGATAHLLVIQALRRAPASVIAPIGYIELVSATILGFLVFDDLPGVTTWIGASLIIGSGLVIAWRETVRRGSGSASIAPSRGPEMLVATGLGLLGFALVKLLLG